MIAAPRIVSIVEGEGEQGAVPFLLERIGLLMEPPTAILRHAPILTSRDLFPRDERERRWKVEQARRQAGDGGGILVLLDSEGEPPCMHARRGAEPCMLGDDLRREVERLAPDRNVAVVFAHRMYETWLIAAADSFQRLNMFRPGITAPLEPESLADPHPKNWLTSWMWPNQKYKPVPDQTRLTRAMNIDMTRQRSPSFDLAYREIERLIRAVHGGEPSSRDSASGADAR